MIFRSYFQRGCFDELAAVMKGAGSELFTWKLTHTTADKCGDIKLVFLRTESDGTTKHSVPTWIRVKVQKLTRMMTESMAEVVVLP
jgi:hypothetical protein